MFVLTVLLICKHLEKSRPVQITSRPWPKNCTTSKGMAPIVRDGVVVEEVRADGIVISYKVQPIYGNDGASRMIIANYTTYS